MDQKQETQVKIFPYRKEDKPRQYANYVRVNSSRFEVTIQFSDVKPASDDAEQAKIKREGAIRTPIDIEIILRSYCRRVCKVITTATNAIKS